MIYLFSAIAKRLAVMLTPFIFIMAVFFFVLQTKNAMSVVNFHADLFEKKETIIIDAGHGGEDGGTTAVNGAEEKEINLAIALALRDLLMQDYYHVVMIRDGDYAVGDAALGTVMERKRSDIHNRLQTIVESGECIYVGIHQNYFTQSQYYGAQVFYSGNREESKVLAESIRKDIVGALQTENTRENKEADGNIYILKHCQVPAVLVECGFLSNPQEAEKLCDPDYQAEMARAIYHGINDYFIELTANESKGS